MQKVTRIAALATLLMVLCVVPAFASTVFSDVQQKQVYWYVKLRSMEFPPKSNNLGSMKVVDWTGYTTYWELPSTALAMTGSYTITYYPASGYVFWRWMTTGGCSVGSVSSNPATLQVQGSGYVIAIYKKA